MGVLSTLLNLIRPPRPDVFVDFRFTEGCFWVDLINIGGAPAYDVSVCFDAEIRGLGGDRSIPELALFRRAQFLPPGKSISAFVDTSAEYFARGEPTQVSIDVHFSDRRGKQRTNRLRHDLEIYRDLGYVRGKPVR